MLQTNVLKPHSHVIRQVLSNNHHKVACLNSWRLLYLSVWLLICGDCLMHFIARAQTSLWNDGFKDMPNGFWGAGEQKRHPRNTLALDFCFVFLRYKDMAKRVVCSGLSIVPCLQKYVLIFCKLEVIVQALMKLLSKWSVLLFSRCCSSHNPGLAPQRNSDLEKRHSVFSFSRNVFQFQLVHRLSCYSQI